MDRYKYFIWYSMILAHNEALAEKIMKKFGDPVSAYMREDEVYLEAGLSKENIEELRYLSKEKNIDDILSMCEKKKISFVCEEDDEFPNLPYVNNRPHLLYYRGELPTRDDNNVSMVGARSCTEYGTVMAKKLAAQFADLSKCIVSGMAVGIDTICHQTALSHNAKTYAVLACGLDIVYPLSNRYLFQAIIDNGSVISEYPPKTAPIARRFPKRNRIISGLSSILVVIEAKKKSGTLITVEHALEQGADVYAVPGRATDIYSEGCNELIKSGAGIITDVYDIYGRTVIKDKDGKVICEKNMMGLEKDFQVLYSCLSLLPVNIQSIIEQSNLEPRRTIDGLVRLKLMDLVEEPVMNYYCIKNE